MTTFLGLSEIAGILKNGNADISGEVSVGAGLTVASNAAVSGTMTVSGAASFVSAVSVGANIEVTGAAVFGGTLTVSGAADFASAVSVGAGLTVASNAAVEGTADFAGAVSIGGVLTVSGAADFAGAVSVGAGLTVASNAAIKTFSQTVSMASGKGFDFTADSNGVFKGIEAVIWRLKSDVTGADDPLGATGGEWEISDDRVNESQLGSGWSSSNETNGIFTFPSTGYWLIRFDVSCRAAISADAGYDVTLSSEVGGSYTALAIRSPVADLGDGSSATCEALLKVENTAHNIKASVTGCGATTITTGSDNVNYTFITFIKLADI